MGNGLPLDESIFIDFVFSHRPSYFMHHWNIHDSRVYVDGIGYV
jgi:hypothetical protein